MDERRASATSRLFRNCGGSAIEPPAGDDHLGGALGDCLDHRLRSGEAGAGWVVDGGWRVRHRAFAVHALTVPLASTLARHVFGVSRGRGSGHGRVPTALASHIPGVSKGLCIPCSASVVLKRLDRVQAEALIAAELDHWHRALAAEPVDVRLRNLPARGQILGGQQPGAAVSVGAARARGRASAGVQARSGIARGPRGEVQGREAVQGREGWEGSTRAAVTLPSRSPPPTLAVTLVRLVQFALTLSYSPAPA